MEHALDMEHENYIRTMEQEYIMGVKIIRTVHIQQKALKFVSMCINMLLVSFFTFIYAQVFLHACNICRTEDCMYIVYKVCISSFIETLF